MSNWLRNITPECGMASDGHEEKSIKINLPPPSAPHPFYTLFVKGQSKIKLKKQQFCQLKAKVQH